MQLFKLLSSNKSDDRKTLIASMEDKIAAGRSDVPGNKKTQGYESPIVKGDRQAGSSSRPKLGTEDGEISLQRSTRLKRLGQDLLQMLEEYREVSASGITYRECDPQVDARPTVKAPIDSSRTSQYPSCSVEVREVDKLEKTKTCTSGGGDTETTGQLGPLGERGFSQGKAALDKKAGMGLEHGNVGIWEHNDAGGEGDRSNSKERVADPSGGGSMDSNPQHSAPQSGNAASTTHAERDHRVNQDPISRSLGGSWDEGHVNPNIDHGHLQVVEGIPKDSSGNVAVDAPRGGRAKTSGGCSTIKNTSASATDSTITGRERRELRQNAIATLSRQLHKTTEERDRLRAQVQGQIWSVSEPTSVAKHGEASNHEKMIPDMVEDVWGAPADADVRCSLQKRKVAREVEQEKQRFNHFLEELRDGNGRGNANVPFVKGFGSPSLRSTGQAAMIMRGTVRYLVMHLTLLSAWRKWKHSVLPPPSPRRTHDCSSSAWKTRQYQPCQQTPPSREVPNAVGGDIPLLPTPILVGDHEGSVGMESFEGGKRDRMIRNDCEKKRRGDKNRDDSQREDQPIISSDFSRSSVACDFGSSERRNAPYSPRTPPRLALRSPLDDDRGPLRAMDGPSRRRDKGKDSKLHVRDVGGSRCLAGGGCKVTPWRPPGSPGTGLLSISRAGSSPRSTPKKPISLHRSGPRRSIAWNGDADTGGSPQWACLSDTSFAGRRPSKSQPLSKRSRSMRTVDSHSYSPQCRSSRSLPLLQRSRVAGRAAIRSYSPQRRPTYLAPTASSRHKTKTASQVKSRDTGDHCIVSRKPFIPSGIGRAQPPKGQSRSSSSHWSSLLGTRGRHPSHETSYPGGAERGRGQQPTIHTLRQVRGNPSPSATPSKGLSPTWGV